MSTGVFPSAARLGYTGPVADVLTTDTAITDDPLRGPAPWSLVLVWSRTDPRAGAAFYVGKRELRLGRDPGDAAGRLVFEDNRMSRFHAQLVLRAAGRLVLTDRGSKNGTFVNGTRIEATNLSDGDVIRLGDSLLLVKRGDADDEPDGRDLGLAGASPAMAQLRNVLRRVAPSPLSVLVQGPTGTGKELVARAIHEQSRRTGRLVCVNCAALPDTLVENALFGHVRGAYTSANTGEEGAFAQAHGGTLFLDEVGELAFLAQPKLLRALETGEITPLGGRARAVDVRVVAATNRELSAEVSAGRFREDLYARLAGVMVRPPRLAARRGDILALFQRFLARAAQKNEFSPDFAEALLVWDWPMNVRELKKLAERLPVLHPDVDRWELAMLERDMQDRVLERHGPAQRSVTPARGHPAIDAAPGRSQPPTRDELIALLAAAGGNVKDVAARMQRSRKQVYRWMDNFQIPRGTGR